jgi:hypothetical protein
MNFMTEERAHPISHLAGSGHGIGKGNNFVWLCLSLLNQASNTMDEDRCFAGAGACDNQHRSVNMVDGFTLAIVGKKGVRL